MKNSYFRTVSLAMAMSVAISGSIIPAKAYASVNNDDFIKGVDVSDILSYENSGVKFGYQNGYKADSLTILKDYGVNYIRVRVWNNPYDSSTGKGYGGGNCDVNNLISIGKRASALGIKLLVDFQYSDFWADPSVQYAPKAWKDYSVSQKSSAIYSFTYSTLKKLMDNNISVGMVQIGNETNGSMCGTGGLYDGTWDLSSGVAEEMKSGCKAVDDINSKYQSKNGKILKALHFTDPLTSAEWYVEKAINAGVSFDAVGLSAYPFWSGNVSELSDVFKRIATNYHKKVFIAETAYPYTFDNSDDTANNINSLNDMACHDYQINVSGQEEAILDLYKAVETLNEDDTTKGYGLGGFYWEPNDIATSVSSSDRYGTGWTTKYAADYEKDLGISTAHYFNETKGSSWDNNALFNTDGNALDSILAFRNMRMNGWSWKLYDPMFYSLSKVTYSFSKNWLSIHASSAKPVVFKKDYENYDGNDYNGCLALSGGGNTTSRSISVNVKNGATIKLVVSGTPGSRKLIISNSNGQYLYTPSINSGLQTITYKYIENSDEIYIFSKANGMDVYGIEVDYE